MISSNQISSIINNQMAGFSNMQGQSANISGMSGMVPPVIRPLGFNYGGMVDPYGEQQSSRMGVGALAALTATPGMLGAGAVMAGGFGLLGSGGQYLDPTTGILRGMSAGARHAAGGVGAAGFKGFFSGMRQAAFSGNLGKFALGGLSAGLATALPYWAAGKALSAAGKHVFGNMVQGGQQDYAVQQSLVQNFDFYNPATRGGRGFTAGQRDQISDMLKGMAESDPFVDMGELNRIMVRSARGGLFQGVNSAKEFGKKFKSLVNTLKDTAKILGTSMDEALSFFDASKRQGFYTKTDILKNVQNAVTMAGGGLSARGIMQTQAAGAAMARSQGFTGAQGATLARRQVQNIRDMVMSGQLSEKDLGEMTGGLRGQAAYRTLGRQMQQASYSLARSGIGRATYAALAQTTGKGADTRFTGKLDEGLLRQFKAGLLSAGDIRRLASQKLQSAGRDTKMSFLNMQQDIQGEFASKAGPEGWMGVISMIKSQRPGISHEAVKLLMKRLTGMGRRQIEYIMKLYNTQDKRNFSNARRVADLLRKRAERADLKMNYTFSGLMRQLGHGVDKMLYGPELRQTGVDVARGGRNIFQSIKDRLLGRREMAGLDAGGQAMLSRTAFGLQGGYAGDSPSALYRRANISGGRFKDMFGLKSAGSEMLRGMGDMADLVRAGPQSGSTVRLRSLGFSGRFDADQRKLAFVSKTLHQAALGIDKDFDAHDAAIKNVRDGIEAISGNALLKIVNAHGNSSQTTHQARVRALGLALQNSDDPRIRDNFENLVRMKAQRIAIGLQDGSKATDPKVLELARQSVIGKAVGKDMRKLLQFGTDQVDKFFDATGTLDAQRIGSETKYARKRAASLLAKRGGSYADSLGSAGMMIGGIGGAILGGGLIGGLIGGLAGDVLGTGIGAAIDFFKGQGRTANMEAALRDPEQRAKIAAMAAGGAAGQKAIDAALKNDDDKQMQSIAKRIQGMSAPHRAELAKSMRTFTNIKTAGAFHIAAQQFQAGGKALQGIDLTKLSGAAREVGVQLVGEGGKGGLAGLMRAAKGGKLMRGGYRSLVEKQLEAARSIAALSDADRRRLRTQLKGSVAGTQLMMAGKTMGSKMRTRLEGLMGMTEGAIEKKLTGIAGMNLGTFGGDIAKTIRRGDIGKAQEMIASAQLRAQQQKATTPFQKLNETLADMNKTNKLMLDAIQFMAKNTRGKDGKGYKPPNQQKSKSAAQKGGAA